MFKIHCKAEGHWSCVWKPEISMCSCSTGKTAAFAYMTSDFTGFFDESQMNVIATTFRRRVCVKIKSSTLKMFLFVESADYLLRGKQLAGCEAKEK